MCITTAKSLLPWKISGSFTIDFGPYIPNVNVATMGHCSTRCLMAATLCVRPLSSVYPWIASCFSFFFKSSSSEIVPPGPPTMGNVTETKSSWRVDLPPGHTVS